MKLNMKKMLISSILIIIPTIITAIFSSTIDGKIAIHWGIDGTPNGYTSPIYFIIFFPVFLLAIQWTCMLITLKTNSNNDQNKKVTEMIYWICPIISIYCSSLILAVSMGFDLNVFTMTSVLFGVLFTVIGNYMPKCKQNSTIGIKIKWTLTNEENWNLTHRFAGKVWFIGGLLLLLCTFVPGELFIYVFFTIIITLIILPFLYSYINYKTQIKENRATKADFEFPKKSKTAKLITTVIISLLIIGVTLIMFVGNVKSTLTDSSIVIESTFYSDMTIEYEDIQGLEFTDELNATRIAGFGSPRLSLGMFSSEEFGNITCFCYTQNKSAVIIKTTNNTLIAINRADKEQTTDLYNEITERIGIGENE